MQIGDKIPVTTQMANYSIDQFPVAVLRDINGDEIPGSPVNLVPEDETGGYNGEDDVFMPDSAWVRVNIVVYADEEHTELSSINGGENYQVYLTAVEESGGGLQNASNIVAVVEPDACSEYPIQDTIIMGSDRTLTVRLIQNANGVPYDLSGATEIEFRFRNADGTVLSLKDTDDDTPVEVINAVAGQLACSVTAEQTALLAPRIPAPFTIKVTKPSGIAVINVLTQLAIEEAAIEEGEV